MNPVSDFLGLLPHFGGLWPLKGREGDRKTDKQRNKETKTDRHYVGIYLYDVSLVEFKLIQLFEEKTQEITHQKLYKVEINQLYVVGVARMLVITLFVLFFYFVHKKKRQIF